MKRNKLSKYQSLKITNINLKDYVNTNRVFGIFWTCTKGYSHLKFCNSISLDKKFKNWASASIGTREVRSFLIDDPDVKILVRK